MPLLGPHMTTAIISALASKGFVGPALPSLAAAVGNGSVKSIVGKAFQTQDTGTGVSAGVGVGVGLTGVTGAAVKGFILVQATAKGFVPTDKSADVYEAVGNALASELALASLTSTHVEIFLGLGTVVPGSIPVEGGEWGGNIKTLGLGLGLAGDKWPDFAAAVGAGCAQGFAPATGQVTITGSPPPTPPGPVPGSTGAGTGVVA